MLTQFFFQLRNGGLKPSITELLTLLDAMKSGLAANSVDDFYFLARASLVKDESQFDLFDRIFSAYFRGVNDDLSDLATELPEDWLRRRTGDRLNIVELADARHTPEFSDAAEEYRLALADFCLDRGRTQRECRIP